MKRQLKRAFENELPDEEKIQFGYWKPGHGTRGKQEWIVSVEDLEDMYTSYGNKKEVLLWAYNVCRDVQKKKRPSSPTTLSQDEAPSSSKKATRRDSHAQKLVEVEDIADELTKKHGAKFTQEQKNVWAHLKMKKHQSLDELPDKPFFKGRQTHKTVRSTSSTADSFSPTKRISLRDNCMDQLSKWHALYKKGVISLERYKKNSR